MKSNLRKLTTLVSLALILSFLTVAACASASPSSEEWEAIFLLVADALEMPVNAPFTVPENPEYEPAYRFVHTLDIGGFMELSYYDDGNGAFCNALLTIDLDYTSAHPEHIEHVVIAIVTTVMSGDLESEEHLGELIEALCPQLEEVLLGEARLSGVEAASLNGITYAMELDNDARIMRLYTHMTANE